MATVITSECINCGACEPECPNTAIYQGGVEWELDGATHPAISDDIFYIVPEKCTECVGFYDHEACAAVCPVDCCVPDPQRPESEAVLLERAQTLHPEATFGPDFPSRFRKGDGAAEPKGNGAAQAAPTAAPAATAPAAAPKPAAPAAGSAAAPAAAPAQKAAVTGRVEKPLPRLTPAARRRVPPPPVPRTFPGELSDDFEEVLGRVLSAPPRRRLVLALVALAQPFLGAAGEDVKRRLERTVGSRAVFTSAGATASNVILNMLLYPALVAAAAVVGGGLSPFSSHLHSYIFYGIALASLEAMLRMREAVFQGVPADRAPFRGSVYAPLASVLARPLLAAVEGYTQQSQVAFDGFYDRRFDEKIERERRYGEAYRLEERGGGYLFQLEFPRRIPPTSLGRELDLPDEMPHYDYDLNLVDGHLTVRGKVGDAQVRKLTAVAPAFPPEFTTRITLPRAVAGFRHRYRDRLLEVVLPLEG
jgi:ferredoxin